jgi:hypothetical protein
MWAVIAEEEERRRHESFDTVVVAFVDPLPEFAAAIRLMGFVNDENDIIAPHSIGR